MTDLQSPWKSTLDAFPENKALVLVLTSGVHPRIGYWGDLGWTITSPAGATTTTMVTHWRPLPPGPHGEDIS